MTRHVRHGGGRERRGSSLTVDVFDKAEDLVGPGGLEVLDKHDIHADPFLPRDGLRLFADDFDRPAAEEGAGGV